MGGRERPGWAREISRKRKKQKGSNNMINLHSISKFTTGEIEEERR